MEGECRLAVQWDEPRIAHAEAALGRVLSFFPRVDAKFSVVLGVGLAMLASIGAGASTVTYWTVGLAVFPLLATVGVAVSLTSVYLGSFPHLKGPDQSLIYFRPIAAKSEPTFIRDFKAQQPEEYLDDLLAQCHRNSEILTIKFDRLELSFKVLAWTIIPWLVSLLLFALLKTGGLRLAP